MLQFRIILFQFNLSGFLFDVASKHYYLLILDSRKVILGLSNSVYSCRSLIASINNGISSI